MDDDSEFDEQKILDLITKNPGIHKSKIAELLEMKINDVEQYLNYLEKKRTIFGLEKVGFKRYYLDKRRIKPRDIRTLETRHKIRNLIARNPGLHLSKIAELTDMSISLTDYHLLCLEKKGEITVTRDKGGHFKRYYIVEHAIESQDREILEILRNKIRLEIVFLLLEHNNLQHNELLKRLNISASTLSYHLTLLANSEIISVTPHGKDKGYVIKDRKEMIEIIGKYNLQIEIGKAISHFVNMWADLKYKDMFE